MRTYPIADHDGTIFAVEIENIYVTPGRLARLLRDIDGVTSVQKRELFGASPDIHVRFAYRGRPFLVWEPYGDSSRYWIGPEDDEGDRIDIHPIEQALRCYQVPWLTKIFGDLISLKFLLEFLINFLCMINWKV